MKKLIALTVVTVALAAPQMGHARGWTVLALGVVDTIDECRAMAEAMFAAVGATIPENQSGDHIVAYNIRGLEIDGATACAKTDDGRVTATLSMHTWTKNDALDQTRLDLSEQMFDIWE